MKKQMTTMTLFNDTEIFAPGTGGRRTFDVPDADLILIDNFFTKEESDRYYNILLHQTQWREYEMPMYDKVVTAPRMVSWYGDTNRSSRKSNPNWPSELLAIRERVENEISMKFNAVLLNLYRNGNDGVSWHSDKTSKQ
jgi:alkylated DNA repair dioxygenase AlkB